MMPPTYNNGIQFHSRSARKPAPSADFGSEHSGHWGTGTTGTLASAGIPSCIGSVGPPRIVLMERGQHNVTEIAGFAGKPFPCPVCNIGLKIKITRKEKPYCICLECGI